MWNFCRAKTRPLAACAAGLLTLAFVSGCLSQSASRVSLYTPVREGQACGPLPDAPVAYYPYQPQTIRSLAELPAAVQGSAAAALRARAGEEVYRQLRFAGGQAVDLVELHRVNPASRGFGFEVPAYLLKFDLSLPDAGLRRYTVSLPLRGDGRPLREADLPAFSTHPEKRRLKPLLEVTADLARHHLIDPAATTATVLYDRPRDALVWHFEQTLPGGGAEVRTRVVDVDAWTGEIIRRS